MDRKNVNHIQFNRRIGFHYFPDTIHYREYDLNHWLPILKSLHASWLYLLAPVDRAIPESFLSGLIQNKIQPILHFSAPLDEVNAFDLNPLLHAYADWGISQVIFFDQPNLRSSWSSANWAKKNIVEQFLDQFIPLAELAIQNNIKPLFPPLFPGGDYWDTVFLRSALQKMMSGHKDIIEQLQLTSLVWTWGKPLNWGAGGQPCWTSARPYSSTENPDQRGFRNFEWYSVIAEEITGIQMPVHLLGAGLPLSPDAADIPDTYFQEGLTETVMQIARTLAGDIEPQEVAQINPISSNVLSTCFWQIGADETHSYARQAWFQTDSERLPVAEVFQKWTGKMFEKEDYAWREKKKMMGLQALGIGVDKTSKPAQPEKNVAIDHSTGFLTSEKREIKTQPEPERAQGVYSPGQTAPNPTQPFIQSKPSAPPQTMSQNKKTAGIVKPIEHYLLLPVYEWGIADWHLEVIRPFIKKYRTTVGFSVKEAALAKKVTVVGNNHSFSDELLEKLRNIGCEVERISGDGTSIASQLSTR